MKIKLAKEWGMRQRESFLKQEPEDIVAHHTGSGEQPNLWIYNKFGSEYCLRSVEGFHVDIRGWNAIGYHYVVFPDMIYECRPIDAIGAHVLNHNRGKIGILVYGNFNYEHPTNSQKELLKFLIEDIRKRVPKTRNKNILTHGDLANTACPGENLQLFIDQLNNKDILVNINEDKIDLIVEKFQLLEKQFNRYKNLIDGLR